MRAFLLSLAAALLLTTSALANLEPEVDEREFKGGNTIDRLAATARMLPREYWPLKYLLSSYEGRILFYRYWLFRMMYGRPGAPAAGSGAMTLMQEPDPTAPPSESVLDQIDDVDAPVMIGEPGTQLRSLDAMGEIKKPSAASTPDQTGESPKAAVNQAAAPKLVEATR